MGAGTLAVNLIARTAQFRTDMRGATGVVRGFSSSVTGIGRKMAGAFGIGGLLSAGGLIVGLKMQADAMDNIAKKSQLLGVSTEAISELGFHARKSGVEARTFELGLQRMTKRIGEAKRGAGEARVAFKGLGIDVADLAGLSGDLQLEFILDALSKIENVNKRIDFAAKIFDSEAVKLLQFGGGGDIRAGRAEARAFGASVTQGQAQAGVAAKDAMERLSTSMDAAVRDLAFGAMPGLTVAIDGLAVWMRSLDTSTPKLIGTLGDVIQAIGLFVKVWELGVARIGVGLEKFNRFFGAPSNLKAAEKAERDKARELAERLVAPSFSEDLARQQQKTAAAARQITQRRDALEAGIAGGAGPAGANRTNAAVLLGSAELAGALAGEVTNKQLAELKQQNRILREIEVKLNPALRRIAPNNGQVVFD